MCPAGIPGLYPSIVHALFNNSKIVSGIVVRLKKPSGIYNSRRIIDTTDATTN
jgi:hypothetical protein